MPLYQEDYSVGSVVRVISLSDLEEFATTWRYHHKLQPEQLEMAGRTFRVRGVNFYHGGEVLYELEGAPSIRHECCLQPAASV